MKKLIAFILALSLFAVMSATALATEIDQDDDPQRASATITTSIAPTYTITIPEDVAVEFDNTSTPFGILSCAISTW